MKFGAVDEHGTERDQGTGTRAFSEMVDKNSLGGKCSKFLFIEQIHANGCWLKAINLIAICSREARIFLR
jgi:hypothetical protein